MYSDSQIAEHDEYVVVYQKLCTIQKNAKFLKERDKGEVSIFPELTSQLEQDFY